MVANMEEDIVYGCMMEQDFIKDIIKLLQERTPQFKMTYVERLNKLKSDHEGQSPEYQALQCELSGNQDQNGNRTALRSVQNPDRQENPLPQSQDLEKKAQRSQGGALRRSVKPKQTNKAGERKHSTELEAEVRKLEKSNAELRQQSSLLGEENQGIKAKLQHLEERCFQLQKENKDLKSKLSEDPRQDDMDGFNCVLSNLQHLQNENIVELLKIDVAQIKGRKCTLEAEAERTNSKLSEETSFKDRCAQLEDEKNCIQKENEALQDKIAKLCTEIDLNRSIKKHCLKVEAEKDCMLADLQVLRKNVTELRNQMESEGSYEHNLAERERLENEVTTLRNHRDISIVQLKNLRSKLQEQAPLKEQCVKLEAEIACSQKENEDIQNSITSVLLEIAQETNLKQKFKELKTLAECLMISKTQLVEYLEKLENEHDDLRVHQPRYEEMVGNVKNLQKHNSNLQNEIDDLKCDIRKRSAAHDSYLQIKDKTVDVEAKNAELQEEKQRLQKKLLKLANVLKTHEQTEEVMDDMRQENRRLHEMIYSLNEQITSKKVLNAQIKTLNMKMKPLKQTHSDLSKKVEGLRQKMQEQLDLHKKIDKLGSKIAAKQLQNKMLQSEFEEIFVKVHSEKLREISLGALIIKEEALAAQNEELKQQTDESNIRVAQA